MTHRTRGFTLLELSIVLVVVGLIAGGVLAAREIIFGSQMRAQLQDVEKLKSAVLGFKLKYGCLPGDCREASLRFNATTQPKKVRDGNGNRRIEISNLTVEGGDQNVGWGYSSGGNHSEWVSVFDHLSAGNMYDIPQYDEDNVPQGSGCNRVACPKLRFKSKGGTSDVVLGVLEPGLVTGFIPGYSYISEGHKIVIGGGSLYAGASAGINPWEASALDSKIDDGRPYKGRAVVMQPVYIYRAGHAGCVDNNDRYYSENVTPVDSGGTNRRYRTCVLYINAEY